MAELLGQDANFLARGAESGQYTAITLPKEDQGNPQEIKLFLYSRETELREDSKIGENRKLSHAEQVNEIDQDYSQSYYEGEGYGYDFSAIPTNDGMEEDNEELITDILERRAAYLYMAFQPPEPVEGPADTLFIVRRSTTDVRKVFIRAHSQVLKRTNDAFDELIGCGPSQIPTPSTTDEAVRAEIQNSGNKEETYPVGATSMYSKILDEHGKERQDQYLQALRETENTEHNKKARNEVDVKNGFEVRGPGPRIGNTMFSEDDYVKEGAPNPDIPRNDMANRPSERGKRQSRAFQGDGHLELGLENVIGSLQDSMKPSVVKAFLEASQNLVQLPGWEHLPPDLKQSFEQFAASVHRFKNQGTETISESKPAEPEVDSRSLESTVLSMVGRWKSKDMLDVLDNISKGVAERRATKILLDKARHEELLGLAGNDVSAKTARTALERRKSQAYLENQQRRQSAASLLPQKRVDLIFTGEKRISPSFLERRQRKASLELVRREKEKVDEQEIYVRRKNSKAAVVAFERRKRMSVLEEKTAAELEFRGGYDGAWPANQKERPPLQAPGRRVSSAALGLSSRTAEQLRTKSQTCSDKDGSERPSGKNLLCKDEAPGTMRGSKAPNERMTRRRRVSESFLERKASRRLTDVKQTEKDIFEKYTNSPKESRLPSQPPLLHYTREQDKDEVVRFYEDEDMDIYNTSSSSSEAEAPPLPNDVDFVIEKMHWTADVLNALMEFIYTETVHIHCEELPDVYRAANEILLSSLTDAISLKPINQYYRLAMVNDSNRKALLNLAVQLTISADYENYVNKNEDFVKLKKLCEAFELDGKLERKPYTLLLETGRVAFRDLTFVTSGLHTIDGQMVLILEDPREGTRLFEQNLEQNEYLTFQKKALDQKFRKQLAERHWLGQWPPVEKTRNRAEAWKVYFFDFPDLRTHIPLKNFVFYKHISSLSMRPIGKEEFSVRVVCGLLLCPVLYEALYLAFPELVITAGRGAGYYMGGETHGQNITMTGPPLYLLRACRALPRHMIGRTVLRVSCPCESTFVKLWMSTNRFGVDLGKQCPVLSQAINPNSKDFGVLV